MSFILEIDDVISPDMCKYVINLFENNNTKAEDGGVVDQNNKIVLDTKTKLTKDLYLSKHEEFRGISSILNNIAKESLTKYIEYLEKTCLATTFMLDTRLSCTVPQIQKYEKGGYFNWHSDAGTCDERLIAYIIYLNTLNEEDGGSTMFANGRIVKPVQGKILFFPCGFPYIHKGEKIKNNTKYIISGFFCKYKHKK